MIEYDPHRWRDHFFDIKGSMLLVILTRVLFCGAAAALAVVVHKYIVPLDFSTVVHQLAGLALGLLLVFRTNASYDRFWEGRKLWGGMVNECRNLARAARTLFGASPIYPELVAWTAAFPQASMHTLRGSPARLDPALTLTADAAEKVAGADHAPLAVSLQMSRCLAQAQKQGLLTDIQHMALDNNVQLLIDYHGGCERIHRTPLPFAYAVHLRRALLLYTLSLPFTLAQSLGWWTVPETLLFAYILFGIEEIGVEIEDPFGTDANDLPLEQICATIQQNLLAIADVKTSETS